MATDNIHLNAFTRNGNSHSPGLWRHPEDQTTRFGDLDYWVDLAVKLEQGKFDAVFLADSLASYNVYKGSRDPAFEAGAYIPTEDPMLPIPAMAQATEHLGFAVTYTTTYTKPYMAARRFSTLDNLTNGRVAWNIVTSYLESEAINLGLEKRMEHDERYKRADEYAEVCYQLWEASWEPDAVVKDPETGVYVDPAKVHEINHDGEYFSVPGPHISEPTPQRTPVIYQAGQSDRGREFAAKHAEAVFSVPQTVEEAKEYAADVRDRAAAYGRSPEDLKIFPGIAPIVAPTETAAHRKFEEYKEYASYDGALALVGGWTDVDLAAHDPDQAIDSFESDANRGIVQALTKANPTVDRTLREVAELVGVGGAVPPVVGTPEQVADELERWIDEAGVDGFNLFEVVRPGTLAEFVDLVVPELQARGRVRKEYSGGTLRENLFDTDNPHLPAHHPGAEVGSN